MERTQIMPSRESDCNRIVHTSRLILYRPPLFHKKKLRRFVGIDERFSMQVKFTWARGGSYYFWTLVFDSQILAPFDSLVMNGEWEKKKGAGFKIHSSMAVVDNAWERHRCYTASKLRAVSALFFTINGTINKITL